VSAGREPASGLTPEEFQREVGVSRETLGRLALYLDLLRHWQSRINLVARSTLEDPWRRHILDSAQLAADIPEGATVLTDIGSGAGFPGLVLAVLGDREVHLVDSDERKCAFLREAVRIVDASATVHCARAETVKPWASDVVTARAVAPISVLLQYSWRFLALSRRPARTCLLLKSENFEEELTRASKNWNMRVAVRPSITDPRGRVLCIRDLMPEVVEDGRKQPQSRRGDSTEPGP
jgi:16S rRNA (guanine527-N7)-methyltransferase